MNIWAHYSFFPFNVFLEPQKYRVYADCTLNPYSSPSSPTQNPSWQTVSNRLQTRGERIYLNTSFQTILSGSGCQQGKKKKHWQQKKAFQCGSVVKNLPACQCRIRRCGFDPWRGAWGWGEGSPAAGNGNTLQHSCLGNSLAGCSP